MLTFATLIDAVTGERTGSRDDNKTPRNTIL